MLKLIELWMHSYFLMYNCCGQIDYFIKRECTMHIFH
uniref:Uncharacterized protein n=1 Tax=Arundo donax TaxID=35708 RepID=A0A0A8YS28_ARUDO